MAWSTVVGAALHAAVFALSPTWEAEDPSSDGASSGPAPVEVVPISAALLPPDRDPVPPPAPPTADRETLDDGEPEGPAAAGDGPGAVTVESAVAEPVEPPEVRRIAVQRVSAVRPQLAVPAPSGWVVVRNRSDVHEFMERVYDGERVDPGAAGSVSVRLWIDEKGSVERARVTDSSGRADLDQIVLDLFERIVSFLPARDRGAPVPTTAVFSVAFPLF